MGRVFKYRYMQNSAFDLKQLWTVVCWVCLTYTIISTTVSHLIILFGPLYASLGTKSHSKKFTKLTYT